MFTCVLKSGGIYHGGHVKRLQEQLDRPLTCLSDSNFEIPHVKIIPLINNWTGWWSKIELFRLHGPVVYLDLDVSICGNPDDLIRDEFTMWEDPLYPEGFNSSVMSWAYTPKRVYSEFCKDPVGPLKNYRRWPYAGDQGFIQNHVDKINKYEDGLILSYRKDYKDNGPKDNTVVVAYHGKPKPWELK